MSLERPMPPTDPIRIPPWPALGSYPTPIDSAQLRRLPLPYPPPSRVPSSRVTALLDSRATRLFLDLEFVKCHGLTTQLLPKPIPVYNINGMPNEAGTINSMVDLVLYYQNHMEHAMFAITSLGRQDMILGFTWLHKHNPKVDWTKVEVTMSRCSWKCSACAIEDRAKHQAQVQEHTAIHACHASPLLSTDLDLLYPPPLVFPCRETLYKDDWSNSRAPEEECRGEFGGVGELEFLDEAVKVRD
ncbi:putative E3 ubiquitin-protein ligase makorin-1 [Termitomyces sp. T112]|nr:putative E3 ubiquitin-protein ligase makorin-1 [Termitomyces sp. T112]